MTLVEQFDALTLTHINEFIAVQQGEDLFLDFKLTNRADLNHGDDKKNLARALSGFGNSGGGLIVWGVDARKNEQGIDCAVAVQEIAPISQFLARLNELTSRAVDPPIEGVRHKSLVVADDRGLAVTLIPESESGPHMAKLGEDRYYKRSGDTFYKMEHFDLEDMFGRRKKPKLRLEARVTRARDEIVLRIGNEGRGTAKAPYLVLSIPEPFSFAPHGVDGNGRDGLIRLASGENDSRKRRYGANLDTVVHPNTALDVTKIEYRGREENRPNGEFIIEYELAAEDTQIVRSNITVNVDVAN